MDALDVLEQIASQVKDCTRCELQFGRRLAVPGEGPADASIMLIGEGPGFHENVQGGRLSGRLASYWMNCCRRLACAASRSSSPMWSNAVRRVTATLCLPR